MNIKDDKIDIQSDDSAASADSGVILSDRLMTDTNRCNIDINTSIESDNNLTSNNATINIENIIKLAKNVSPTRNVGSTKKTTPTNGSSSSAASSLRSTRISITSIHSDASSSVIDSDCDFDDCGEDSNGNYTITKLGHQTSCLPGYGSAGIPNIGGSDGLVLLEQRVDVEHNMNVLAMASAASASTSLGCGSPQMAFTNSSDITIGQKNYYQGPVTIQQFLIENRNRDGECLQGTDNPSFQNDSPNGLRKTSSDQKDCNDKNSSQDQPYKFNFNRKAVIVTAIIITLTIVIGGIFATTSFMMKRSSKQEEDDEETRKHIPVNNTIGKDNFGGGSILRLVTRDEWLARPESEPLTLLKLPVHRVIIAHTATGLCTSQAACALQTQNIQNFHMDSRNYGDIGYNFLVGGDGAVYEGRGWEKQGAHTLGFNVDSICIAFIGTFVKLTPTEGQLNAAKLIIAEGVRLKKLVDDYRLYGARQFVGTESPGNALFEIIKKWPHWSSKRF